eukprot:scaffold5933_cov41-Cyclotella_meneghiniana.AAC.1
MKSPNNHTDVGSWCTLKLTLNRPAHSSLDSTWYWLSNFVTANIRSAAHRELEGGRFQGCFFAKRKSGPPSDAGKVKPSTRDASCYLCVFLWLVTGGGWTDYCSVEQRSGIIRRDGYWHIADKKGNVANNLKRSLYTELFAITYTPSSTVVLGVHPPLRLGLWTLSACRRADMCLVFEISRLTSDNWCYGADIAYMSAAAYICLKSRLLSPQAYLRFILTIYQQQQTGGTNRRTTIVKQAEVSQQRSKKGSASAAGRQRQDGSSRREASAHRKHGLTWTEREVGGSEYSENGSIDARRREQQQGTYATINQKTNCTSSNCGGNGRGLEVDGDEVDSELFGGRVGYGRADFRFMRRRFAMKVAHENTL